MSIVNKTTFAERIQGLAARISAAARESSDIEGVYFDRGYDGGGSDPIIDDDVSDLGITAADITAFISLAQQLDNFVNNQAVTSGDYNATLNNLRTDV